MSNKPGVFPSWHKTFYGHLALARISNSPTVVSDTLAGAALAGSLWPDAKIGLVAIAMVLFYSAGMYLNDLLDYAIDCHERPERPLPAGTISRTTVRLVVIALFVLGSLILWLIGPVPFCCGLILIALIVCYNCWHKQNPLSPFFMALCRLMVYVTAFCAYAPRTLFALLIPGELLLCYVVALTMLAKAERKPAAIHLGIVIMLFLPALYFVLQASTVGLGMVLLFTTWMTYSLSLVHRAVPRQIGRAVGQLIAGIALLDGLVLAEAGSIAGVMLALASFGLTLFLQRYVKGT